METHIQAFPLLCAVLLPVFNAVPLSAVSNCVPGNVFVEPVPGSSNGTKVRPVLLDWGFLATVNMFG